MPSSSYKTIKKNVLPLFCANSKIVKWKLRAFKKNPFDVSLAFTVSAVIFFYLLNDFAAFLYGSHFTYKLETRLKFAEVVLYELSPLFEHCQHFKGGFVFLCSCTFH